MWSEARIDSSQVCENRRMNIKNYSNRCSLWSSHRCYGGVSGIAMQMLDIPLNSETTHTSVNHPGVLWISRPYRPQEGCHIYPSLLHCCLEWRCTHSSGCEIWSTLSQLSMIKTDWPKDRSWAKCQQKWSCSKPWHLQGFTKGEPHWNYIILTHIGYIYVKS